MTSPRSIQTGAIVTLNIRNKQNKTKGPNEGHKYGKKQSDAKETSMKIDDDGGKENK
jgi:hypothetical protein